MKTKLKAISKVASIRFWDQEDLFLFQEICKEKGTTPNETFNNLVRTYNAKNK